MMSQGETTVSEADLIAERPELLEWQKELLDQRLRDAEAHPEDWVSWDEAKQRLERQLQGH
jgi:Putative addiction module component